MLGVSETSPGVSIGTEGAADGTEAGIGVEGKKGRSSRPIELRGLTCRAQGGWYIGPLCLVDFLVLQMSQEEEILKLEDTLSLEDSGSEMFQTAEGVSSADEADGACLAEEEGERPEGADAPRPEGGGEAGRGKGPGH